VAVAALVLWLCTAAVGAYMLVRAMNSGNPRPGPRDAAVSAERPVSVAADPAGRPAKPVSARDLFDPPSLQRAKAEELPGLRDLAEFAHPALAVIGLGFWFGYFITRDQTFAAIGLGIVLGAICAGLSWFTVNRRDAKRAAAGEAAETAGEAAGESSPGQRADGVPQLSFPPRLLALHAIGAALTLLFAVLIVARV
jgi:hypothetical protein